VTSGLCDSVCESPAASSDGITLSSLTGSSDCSAGVSDDCANKSKLSKRLGGSDPFFFTLKPLNQQFEVVEKSIVRIVANAPRQIEDKKPCHQISNSVYPLLPCFSNLFALYQ
jgi:hypothetical protein